MQRARNLSVRGLPTQPDPLERAEAVQGTWQLLWTEAARRRAWLQNALLVGQVERAGWGRAGVWGQMHALNPSPPPHSTFLTQPRQLLGFSCGRSNWKAHPAGRTRQRQRSCCSATCSWNEACAPSGRNCASWRIRRGRPQPRCRSRCAPEPRKGSDSCLLHVRHTLLPAQS